MRHYGTAQSLLRRLADLQRTGDLAGLADLLDSLEPDLRKHVAFYKPIVQAAAQGGRPDDNPALRRLGLRARLGVIRWFAEFERAESCCLASGTIRVRACGPA